MTPETRRLCAECGKPIEWQDGPYSNSNGGPWHRLCIPPSKLTNNISGPLALHGDLALSSGPARRRNPSDWAHKFRDYSGQEWAIDYDDSCYVLFFKGDEWRETIHWPRDAVEEVRKLPSNPRDYAEAKSSQERKPKLRVVKP